MATAADFETIEVPNIGSYGRMVPVHNDAVLSNVGANWIAVGYTVPSGRVLALDWATLIHRSGTVPITLQILLYDAAGVRQGHILRTLAGFAADTTTMTNTVWIPSGWTLRFAIGGGDATTDVTWSYSGRLFDWTDFAS